MFAWALLVPVLMLSQACEEEEIKDGNTVTVSLKADATFSEAGEATLTVTLSEASDAAVTVTLGSLTEAQEGFTAMDAELLSYENPVTVAAGSTSQSVVVTADLTSLDETVQAVKERILGGLNVALISDAGTPGISDPGFLLARTCAEEGIEVQTLPGATACIPAIVSSGLPCDRFCFEGFLPQKKGRQTLLRQLASETRTMVFYESPYRLVKTLEQFAEHFGEERRCSVAREISKVHEEHRRGTLSEVAAWFREHEPKGEIVIVVAGAEPVKTIKSKRYGRGEEESESEE